MRRQTSQNYQEDPAADLELETTVCEYEVGDNVVYPHHGAGVVLKKETRDMMGESRDYLTIKILHNDMTVMVPCENAHRADYDEDRRGAGAARDRRAHRRGIGDAEELEPSIQAQPREDQDRHYELAEVVRNLAIREWEKGSSTGEKQMYTRAKKILASEFMYALDKDEEGAEEYIDELLEERRRQGHGLAPSSPWRRSRPQR